MSSTTPFCKARTAYYDWGAAIHSGGGAGLNNSDVLEAVTFGQRIAEQEVDELSSYFVETVTWRSIYAGEVDVVYGPKGSGKSALYSLLRERELALRARRIVLVSAENPSGAPIFRDLVADPPASVADFRNLWKLYILALVARQLREQPAGDIWQRVTRAGFPEASHITRSLSICLE